MPRTSRVRFKGMSQNSESIVVAYTSNFGKRQAASTAQRPSEGKTHAGGGVGFPSFSVFQLGLAGRQSLESMPRLGAGQLILARPSVDLLELCTLLRNHRDTTYILHSIVNSWKQGCGSRSERRCTRSRLVRVVNRFGPVSTMYIFLLIYALLSPAHLPCRNQHQAMKRLYSIPSL